MLSEALTPPCTQMAGNFRAPSASDELSKNSLESVCFGPQAIDDCRRCDHDRTPRETTHVLQWEMCCKMRNAHEPRSTSWRRTHEWTSQQRLVGSRHVSGNGGPTQSRPVSSSERSSHSERARLPKRARA